MQDNLKISALGYLERKSKIYVKEYDHETKEANWVARDFAPKIFLPTKKVTGYTSYTGLNLELIERSSIREMRNFIKELDSAAASLWGFGKYSVQYICQAGYADAQPDFFSSVFYDIETEVNDGFPDAATAKEAINMITLIPKDDRRGYALTTCSVRAKEIEEEFPFLQVKMYRTEQEMLMDFIHIFVNVLRVDVFVGWNSEKFDVPFIVHRIIKILGQEWANKLSPFGEVYTRTFTDDFGEEITTAEIVGVQLVDHLQYYKKFSHEARESYSLDNIAHVELGVGKLTHESGIPGHLLYHEYPTDGLRYNIVDVLRLKQIDEVRGILDLAFIVANMTKSNVADVVFSTRLWMNLIYDFLARRNQFFEFRPERNTYRKIEGGFVACHYPGLHEYVGSFDFASLYPNTMMALNLGPDTKDIKVPGVTVDALLNGEIRAPEGLSMGANGQCFRTDKMSFFVELVDHGYAKRREYKALKLKYQKEEQEETDEVKKKEIGKIANLWDNYDKSQKTILNSFYGALAEKNFHFYDPDMAEAITLTGQFMVRNLSNVFTKVLTKNYGSGRYIIANDTDSAYISFQNVVEKQFADSGADEHERIEWLCKYADGPMKKVVAMANERGSGILNAYDPSRFEADREAVARRAVFLKKKMYAIALSDMEGVRYKKPKIKVVGLAAKKSSTPGFFRDKMKHFFELFLNGQVQESIDYMSDIESKYREAPIDEIASNASVSDIISKADDDSFRGYGKGVHINARAAIVYNKMISKDEKARAYLEPIKNGEKIKMLPLRVPNPLMNENVVAWKDTWPEYYDRLKIKEYVDWNTHFFKAFSKPLDSIYNICGINPHVSKELDIF
ncbi:DNA polymerase family B protein [Rhizobium phage RHph_Y68]|uniref:DNA-directed DNA polymerase n=1 Tax=Rhizobium phage RHph_Y68 TaxID=2509787 RepID=A0A7S5R519_9CAUD|nr:DNA polymerase family B protein [Rhizobium phage RHph_Y68]QIG68110.1 DNA polymerase family B protein [Rhizobium phage RHph_Y68]